MTDVNYVDLARDTKDIVAYGVVAILLVGGGVNMLLRRWSKTKLQDKSDRAEETIIARLERQLQQAFERADMFAHQRNKAIEELGELRWQLSEARLDLIAVRAETAKSLENIRLMETQIKALQRQVTGDDE